VNLMPMIRKRLRAPDHFGRLFLVLTLDLAFSGFHATPLVSFVNAALGVATVIVGVTATGLRGRFNQWQLAALLALVLVTLVAGAIDHDVSQGVASTTGAIALGVLMVAALAEVLAQTEVDLQTLFGALCVYLLLGLLFARVYTAWEAFAPNPVLGGAEPIDTTYFSFTTLTTVGYGDILAVGPVARRIAVIEGMVGQVFLATTVARLMSLYRSPRRPEVAEPPTTGEG
jgi:hypothetical protein